MAAATTTLAMDARAEDAPLNPEEIGVTATLKPHQVEGVSWLIRRYVLGVNVVLGKVFVFGLLSVPIKNEGKLEES